MSELPYVAPDNAPNYYDKYKPEHLEYDPKGLGFGYYEVSTDKLTEGNYKPEFAKLKNSMLAKVKVDRPDLSIDCLVKYGAFSWKQDQDSMMTTSSEFRNFPLFQARLYGKNGEVNGGLGLSSFDDLQKVDDYEIGIKKNLLSTPPMGDKTTIQFAIKKDIIKSLQCPPTPNTAIAGGRRHRYGRRSRRGAVKRTKINKRKSSSRVLSKSRRRAQHSINRK